MFPLFLCCSVSKVAQVYEQKIQKIKEDDLPADPLDGIMLFCGLRFSP